MRVQTLCPKAGTSSGHGEPAEESQKVESHQKVEFFHGSGKINSPKEKIVDNLSQSGKDSLTCTQHPKDMEESMQWENVPDYVGGIKSDEGRQHTQEITRMGPVDKENLDWAEDTLAHLQ